MDEAHNAHLDRLYQEHYKTIFRYCAAYVKNAPQYQQLIEDCVQDAFVKAVIHYDEFKNYKNPAGWIAITDRNQLRDALQKKSNQTRLVASYTDITNEETAFSHTPIDNAIKREEIILCLSNIYSDLTDIEKTVFREYFIEDKSMHATAESSGLSLNSVRSGINRIRKRARKHRNLFLLILIRCIFYFSPIK